MPTQPDPWRLSGVAMDVMAATVDSPARLQARQARRLAALLAHAQANSPLFAERLAGLDPTATPLAALPVSHRHALMADFDRWVTDPALRLADLRRFLADPSRIGEPFAGGYTVWESSGTSGQSGVFVQEPAAMAVYDALEALRRSDPDPWRRWLNPFGLGERWACVGATGGHFATLVSLKRLTRRHPGLSNMLQVFSIMQPTADLVAALDAYQPTVVATYPTAAALLADEAAAGRLHSRPREVWTGGETLGAGMRSHIAQALGAAVRNSYGASEFLPIGWECRHGRMHVNADWVILEPVDDQYRPVPPGQCAHTTLLTNLANPVQPLIRYELGDRITVDPTPCPCGSGLPVVQVQGRDDDPLHLAGARGHDITLLPLALSTVLEEEAGVYDYELVQQDRHTLLLKVPLPPDEAAPLLARGCAALTRFAAAQGVARPKVLGEASGPVPRGRSGKARRVQGLAPAARR